MKSAGCASTASQGSADSFDSSPAHVYSAAEEQEHPLVRVGDPRSPSLTPQLLKKADDSRDDRGDGQIIEVHGREQRHSALIAWYQGTLGCRF